MGRTNQGRGGIQPPTRRKYKEILSIKTENRKRDLANKIRSKSKKSSD